jgi:hypothetical protein
MVANKPVPGKKYYTVAEANATLPLVRAIIQDITQLAGELSERQERLERVQPNQNQRIGAAYQEEMDQVRADIERGHQRMREYLHELAALGIELKDYQTGLVDYPCWMGNREVYLCWRLGEPEVGHWHEVDAGFAGRQKLKGIESRLEGAEAGARTPER